MRVITVVLNKIVTMIREATNAQVKPQAQKRRTEMSMSMQELAPAERRRESRQRAVGDSVLYAEKFGAGIFADVENVSLGGMMATTLRPIKGDEDFLVLLFGEDCKDLVCRRAKIAWQSTGDDGKNHVGLEFLQAPTDDLLKWMQKASGEEGGA